VVICWIFFQISLGREQRHSASAVKLVECQNVVPITHPGEWYTEGILGFFVANNGIF